jgi:hypothetical protein
VRRPRGHCTPLDLHKEFTNVKVHAQRDNLQNAKGQNSSAKGRREEPVHHKVRRHNWSKYARAHLNGHHFRMSAFHLNSQRRPMHTSHTSGRHHDHLSTQCEQLQLKRTRCYMLMPIVGSPSSTTILAALWVYASSPACHGFSSSQRIKSNRTNYMTFIYNGW